jgi:hypothetical protein
MLSTLVGQLFQAGEIDEATPPDENAFDRSIIEQLI